MRSLDHPRHAKLTRLIRDHWNERAPTFDDEPGHGLLNEAQHTAWVDVLMSITGGAPQRILDVGCGTGFLALMLSEMGHAVTGIDLAPQMLSVAQQKARRAGLQVQFRLENATSLSDAEACYDLVVARHVIWALPDPVAGVKEWLRVVRPGGRLALIEGQWYSNEGTTNHPMLNRMRLGAQIGALLRIAYYGVRERQWALVPAKLRDWRYQQVETKLPFYGGPSAERLVTLLEAQGVRDVTITPLMNPVLWGGEPRYSRYLAVGSR